MNPIRPPFGLGVRGFVLVSLLAPALTAQGLRLNAPLVRPVGGDITRFEVSRDGTRVVYVADQDADDVFELFSAKTTAPDAWIRLAGPSVEGGDVGVFAIDPSGRYVAFSGDLGVDEDVRLHRVPIDGGAVIELADVPATSFTELRFDARGTSLFVDARVPSGFLEHALFRVPVDGGLAVRLDVGGGRSGVDRFEISPDGRYVAYVSDETTPFPLPGHNELFGVSAAGSGRVKLNPEGTEVDEEHLSVDGIGNRVLFFAWPHGVTPRRTRLYSAPLDGSQRASQLTERTPLQELRISPDGKHVVCASLVSGVTHLLAIPVDGSAAPRMLFRFAPSSFAREILVPDSGFALFVAEALGVGPLYRVRLDGASPAVEIAPQVDELVAASASRVVYTSAGRLMSAAIDGTSPPIELASGANPHSVSPDFERVVYLSLDQASLSGYDLFSVPVLGGKAPVRLNETLPYDGTVQNSASSIRFCPLDDARVLYLASQTVADRFELFSAPLDGDEPSFRVNAELPIGPVTGDVGRMTLSPDGDFAVYRADQETDGLFELFGVRTDRPGESYRISAPMVLGENLVEFAITSDGTRVVYSIGTILVATPRRLKIAPIAGGASIDLGSFDGLSGLRVDPGATRAIFREWVPSAGASRLLSVPLDGSAGATELVGASSSTQTLLISPGGRLLYREAGGLYSIPVDGSTSAVLLASIAPGRSLFALTFDASGTKAVYGSDALVSGRNEPFVVPVDGSAAPLALIPTLGNDRDAGAPQVSSDGFVFFGCDLDVDGVFELFRVPIAGGTTPSKLSAPLVSNGDVDYFRVSPDGQRVVYRADQEVDERYELFGVPANGSAPAKKLNGALGSGDVGIIEDYSTYYSPQDVFAFNANGTRVAFIANPGGGLERKLFAAPSDGSAAALEISSPAPFRGGVVAFRPTPDGTQAVYAVEAAWGDYRLFRAPLAHAGRARPVSGIGRCEQDLTRNPVPAFAFTGEGRIVFHCDQATRGVFEIFASELGRPVREIQIR